MSQTISILGCGWLGLPLGQHLASLGFTVKGSVRNKENFDLLSIAGIEPYLLNVEPDRLSLNDPGFFKCDILLISIPPGRKDGSTESFPKKMKILRSAIDINGIKKVIFISSTSVYPENKKMVKEEDAINPNKRSGELLLEAEQVLQSARQFDLTILRFAGLIGLDRNPLNFLKKDKTGKSSNMPMNLIHVDDGIGVILSVIQNKLWNNIFNACCDEHPTRHAFYSLAAELNGLEPPVFYNDQHAEYKLVNSNKFVTLSGYHFKYRNPLDYVRDSYLRESPH